MGSQPHPAPGTAVSKGRPPISIPADGRAWWPQAARGCVAPIRGRLEIAHSEQRGGKKDHGANSVPPALVAQCEQKFAWHTTPDADSVAREMATSIVNSNSSWLPKPQIELKNNRRAIGVNDS
jgi:hypothetical protein